MARTNNLTDFLTDVSSAIKQKTGDSAPIPASEFDTEILNIETAGNYQSKTLNITQNGNYNLLPDQEFDAISNVNISVSVSPVLQNKTITENGSYTADQNYDGLGTVIVNVPQTGDVPVKLFETQEEMQADQDAKEGDLALVYRSETQNVTVDSQFQTAVFPDTVVLDTAITDYVDVRYSAVDSSVMFDCWGSLDSSNFMMDCYTESGSINIQYTSEDGITYTRTDTTGNPVDFGTEIYYEYTEMWNDAIGKFIQYVGMNFEGLYEYTLNVTEPWICNFINTFDYINGKVANVDIKQVDVSKLMSIVDRTIDYIPRVTILINKQNENDVYIISNDGMNVSYLYDTANNKYIGSECWENPNNIYHINLENESLVEVNKADCDWFKLIENTTTYYADATNYYTFVIYQYNNKKFNDGGSSNYFFLKTVNGTTIGSSTNIEEGIYTERLVHDTYIAAKTQFTATESDLIAGKVALGKTGEIVGDGSIFNNIDYTKAWEDSNLQLKDVKIYMDLTSSTPPEYKNTTAIKHFKADKNGIGSMVCVESINGDKITADNGYYYRYECTDVPGGWLCYTTTSGDNTKTSIYKYNIDTNSYTLLNSVVMGITATQSNGSYGFWTKYDETNNVVKMLVFSTSDYKLHLYNLNLDTNEFTEISSSVALSLSSNEYSSIQWGIADFDKEAIYYGYGGIYKITFSGTRTSVISGSYYSRYDRSNFSHRYMNVSDKRVSQSTVNIFDTVTETMIATDTDWYKSGGVMYSARNHNVLVSDTNVTILDENLNVLNTIDASLSEYRYAVSDSTGVITKTNGIVLTSSSFRCVYVDFDTNTIVYPMFLIWGTMPQYGSVIPLSYNADSPALTAASYNYNNKVYVILGTIDDTSDILLYNTNSHYKPLISDFNKLITKTNIYENTISPTEYDTAIDTVNKILGEEV